MSSFFGGLFGGGNKAQYYSLENLQNLYNKLQENLKKNANSPRVVQNPSNFGRGNDPGNLSPNSSSTKQSVTRPNSSLNSPSISAGHSSGSSGGTTLNGSNSLSATNSATANIAITELIREITEIMIYGEKYDLGFFDFFCEKNLLSDFIKIYPVTSPKVKIQLLQTLSILITNVDKNITHLYYLFSNNYLNNLIILVADIIQRNTNNGTIRNTQISSNVNVAAACTTGSRSEEEEEVVAYFISFLKSLALKLDTETVKFFLNNRFPMYTNSLKFHLHPDHMVRTHIRTITLAIFKLAVKEKANVAFNARSEMMHQMNAKGAEGGKGSGYSASATAPAGKLEKFLLINHHSRLYFINFACHLREKFQELNKLASKMPKTEQYTQQVTSLVDLLLGNRVSTGVGAKSNTDTETSFQKASDTDSTKRQYTKAKTRFKGLFEELMLDNITCDNMQGANTVTGLTNSTLAVRERRGDDMPVNPDLDTPSDLNDGISTTTASDITTTAASVQGGTAGTTASVGAGTAASIAGTTTGSASTSTSVTPSSSSRSLGVITEEIDDCLFYIKDLFDVGFDNLNRLFAFNLLQYCFIPVICSANDGNGNSYTGISTHSSPSKSTKGLSTNSSKERSPKGSPAEGTPLTSSSMAATMTPAGIYMLYRVLTEFPMSRRERSVKSRWIVQSSALSPEAEGSLQNDNDLQPFEEIQNTPYALLTEPILYSLFLPRIPISLFKFCNDFEGFQAELQQLDFQVETDTSSTIMNLILFGTEGSGLHQEESSPEDDRYKPVRDPLMGSRLSSSSSKDGLMSSSTSLSLKQISLTEIADTPKKIPSIDVSAKPIPSFSEIFFSENSFLFNSGALFTTHPGDVVNNTICGNGGVSGNYVDDLKYLSSGGGSSSSSSSSFANSTSEEDDETLLLGNMHDVTKSRKNVMTNPFLKSFLLSVMGSRGNSTIQGSDHLGSSITQGSDQNDLQCSLYLLIYHILFDEMKVRISEFGFSLNPLIIAALLKSLSMECKSITKSSTGFPSNLSTGFPASNRSTGFSISVESNRTRLLLQQRLLYELFNYETRFLKDVEYWAGSASNTTYQKMQPELENGRPDRRCPSTPSSEGGNQQKWRTSEGGNPSSVAFGNPQNSVSNERSVPEGAKSRASRIRIGFGFMNAQSKKMDPNSTPNSTVNPKRRLFNWFRRRKKNQIANTSNDKVKNSENMQNIPGRESITKDPSQLDVTMSGSEFDLGVILTINELAHSRFAEEISDSLDSSLFIDMVNEALGNLKKKLVIPSKKDNTDSKGGKSASEKTPEKQTPEKNAEKTPEKQGTPEKKTDGKSEIIDDEQFLSYFSIEWDKSFVPGLKIDPEVTTLTSNRTIKSGILDKSMSQKSVMTKFFTKKSQETFDNATYQAITHFLLLAKLKLEIKHMKQSEAEPDKPIVEAKNAQPTLEKIISLETDSQLKIGNVFNLGKKDRIVCTIINNGGKRTTRYFVVHPYLFLLVQPDLSTPGYAIVTDVCHIQHLEIVSRQDSKILVLSLKYPNKANNKEVNTTDTLTSSKGAGPQTSTSPNLRNAGKTTDGAGINKTGDKDWIRFLTLHFEDKKRCTCVYEQLIYLKKQINSEIVKRIKQWVDSF